jgi:cytochrome c
VVDVWTPEQLNAFLVGPKAYAPGTSMGYNGMRKIEDRANLIAYLDSLDD